MSGDRWAASVVGALVATGVALALVPGTLSLGIASLAAVLAIAFERLISGVLRD